MAPYWFKQKTYGIGIYPVTWQGWLALLCLCALITVSFYINIMQGQTISSTTLKDWLQYGLDVIILGALFHVILKDKVEGEIRWRWGAR